jgi:hypothetical protein
MPSKRKNKTTKRNKHMRNKKSKTVRKFRKITGGELDYLSVSGNPDMAKYLQQRQAEDEAKKLKKEIDKKRRETVAMYEGV